MLKKSGLCIILRTFAQILCLFQNVQNTDFLLLYYSACKKATEVVFIWVGRGYPADCLNTKWPLSDIWLLRNKQNSFGCFRKNSDVPIFKKNTQNCFAHNSSTKYRSETFLYSKRTAGYPLSPEIKTMDVAFLQAE